MVIPVSVGLQLRLILGVEREREREGRIKGGKRGCKALCVLPIHFPLPCSLGPHVNLLFFCFFFLVRYSNNMGSVRHNM
jgi:hypothetical protein